MKKTFVRSLLLLPLILLLCLVTSARAELNLDFSLINSTGYDIKEVYIGPSTSDEWGENILKKILKDGLTLEITFNPKATAKKWDIKCVYTDGEVAQWKGLKLEEISKMTLFWSEKKGSTYKAE